MLYKRDPLRPKDFDLDRIIYLVTRPIIEIAYGVRSKSIDWLICLLPGCLFSVLVATKMDLAFFRLTKMLWLLPPTSRISYNVYCAFAFLSGFICWGLWQTVRHNQLSKRLTEVFHTSGLKNSIGKLPGFVFDKPIDEYTRKMRLTRSNLPVSAFLSSKENLESALQVFIDEIKENRESGTVDIIYSGSAIPKDVKLTDLYEVGSCRFYIGQTRAQKITADFRETPHFLVGGQSGGGKSTFLRQAITTLFLNNPDFNFILIDLKGGLEFQIFENIKRMTVVPDAQKALIELIRLEEDLTKRMAALKASKCKDIDAYMELSKEERKGQIELNRKVVVIDEAAELFMAGDKSGANAAQQAKRLTVKLAAQGRAVGIHLIIATQRPDVKAVDGQIKANLPGIVAFQMPNNATSLTILDSIRASHLPKIPGRCIWKTSLDQTEVQTPFLDMDEAIKLLKPFVEEPTEEKSNAEKQDDPFEEVRENT